MRWPVQSGGRVQRQKRKVDGRRKPVVGKKVQPEDATDDEGLEVGPKVKPEEQCSTRVGS